MGFCKICLVLRELVETRIILYAVQETYYTEITQDTSSFSCTKSSSQSNAKTLQYTIKSSHQMTCFRYEKPKSGYILQTTQKPIGSFPCIWVCILQLSGSCTPYSFCLRDPRMNNQYPIQWLCNSDCLLIHLQINEKKYFPVTPLNLQMVHTSICQIYKHNRIETETKKLVYPSLSTTKNERRSQSVLEDKPPL